MVKIPPSMTCDSKSYEIKWLCGEFIFRIGCLGKRGLSKIVEINEGFNRLIDDPMLRLAHSHAGKAQRCFL